MQDALLIYYMVANLLHAGYFADIAKVVQQAVTQLRVAVAGLRNSRAGRRSSPISGNRLHAGGVPRVRRLGGAPDADGILRPLNGMIGWFQVFAKFFRRLSE